MKKLLFVFNPHAGKGQIKDNLCDIVDIFTKGGYEVVTYPTQAKLDGYNKLCQCGQDYDMIVTSGGDGTLSEAVKAMMTFDKKIPLGYIPAGSTNDCAQSLSIPKKMLDAAREIVDGVYFDYDVGKFNGQYFVYVAGFGAFTDVSYETSQTMKNKFGHAAYVAEGIKRLSKITGQQMRVEHDGEKAGEQTGEHVFSFRVPLTGEIEVKAVAGDCTDTASFRHVDTPNPSYKLVKTKSKSANWV